MLSEKNILIRNDQITKVVVVCHNADWEEAKCIIDGSAPIGWREHGEIRLLEAGTRPKYREKKNRECRIELEVEYDPDFLRRTLDKIAPAYGAPRVLIVGNIRLYPALNQSDPRAPIRLASPAELQKHLPQVLASMRLDWLSHLMHSLEHYHVEISREDVESWRQQFADFGTIWVADALLKLLDFWPSNKISKALFSVPGLSTESTDNEIHSWLSEYDHIAFNDAESGDSSAMICRLTKARIGALLSSKRSDFTELVNKSGPASKILFMEDCLLTGTEIIRLFQSLPAEALRLHSIDMKFAVGTESGKRKLETYLRSNGFSNVRIFVPNEGLIQNLTEAGKVLTDRSLFGTDGGLVNPSEHVYSGIEMRASGVFNDAQRTNIVSMCKSISAPLMRLHLQRMNWAEERIEAILPRWELGFSGLGLLLAFAHGIPKPALPLLWIEGNISVEHFRYRKRLDWIPLFPRPLQERITTVASAGNY